MLAKLSGVTDTVVDCVAEPPAPVQVIENVVVAVSGPVDAVPLAAMLEVHPPTAAQEVAFVEIHEIVELFPLETDVGLADRFKVGDVPTVTVAVPGGETSPFASVQVIA